MGTEIYYGTFDKSDGQIIHHSHNLFILCSSNALFFIYLWQRAQTVNQYRIPRWKMVPEMDSLSCQQKASS